jgi:FG-GAP repeat
MLETRLFVKCALPLLFMCCFTVAAAGTAFSQPGLATDAPRSAPAPSTAVPVNIDAGITASDGAASGFFGYGGAVSGTLAVIGACGKTVGGNTGQGAAYVFDISNPSSPVQTAILCP